MMNTKSPQSLLSALAFSFLLGSGLSAQFVENFENLNAGSSGMPLVGQGGWTAIPSNASLSVVPQQGTSWVPPHPGGGGLQLVSGIGPPLGASHPVTFGLDAWSITWDAFIGSPSPALDAQIVLRLDPNSISRDCQITLGSRVVIGSFPRARVSLLCRSATNQSVSVIVPGTEMLLLNRWYRISVSLDFVSNQIFECRVTDLVTGAIIVHYPQNCYLGGGASPAPYLLLPSVVSIRAASQFSGLAFGLDNLRIEPVVQWQINQSDSTFLFDGRTGTATSIANVTRCVGSFGALMVASTELGLPWDLGISALPSVPRNGGGLMTSGGQIVNLDIADPAFTWLLGLSGSVPFASFTSSVPLTIPGRITAQMFVASPTRPEGYALSGASEVEIVASSATVHCQAGPTTDNGSVPLTIPPGWPAIRFCGQAWTSVFINANGTLSFGAPQTAPTPTVASFLSGPPSLALLWTDLNPSAGGAITSVLEFDGFSPSYQFKFFGLPAGVGGAPVQHSVSVEFSGDSSIGATPTTQSASLRFQVAPGHTLDSLIGISPGNGASPFPVQFDMTASGANPPTDAVLDFRQGAVPIGFGGITIPFADPTQWFVN